ncbi:hypothetical protein ACLOJK_019376 [Asimina triloba]
MDTESGVEELSLRGIVIVLNKYTSNAAVSSLFKLEMKFKSLVRDLKMQLKPPLVQELFSKADVKNDMMTVASSTLISNKVLEGTFSCGDIHACKKIKKIPASTLRNAELNQILELRMCIPSSTDDLGIVVIGKISPHLWLLATFPAKRLLLDPAIHEEFTRLKNLVEEKDKKVKELQDNVAAVNFTPSSKMGKMLMAKCRTLQEENEEVGQLHSEGKIHELTMKLALQKAQNTELRGQFEGTECGLYKHMDELTNDVEKSNEMQNAKEKIVCEFIFHKDNLEFGTIYIITFFLLEWKGSLGATVTGSSCGNNLLLRKIWLHTIDLKWSPDPVHSESLMHRAALPFLPEKFEEKDVVIKRLTDEVKKLREENSQQEATAEGNDCVGERRLVDNETKVMTEIEV